MNEWNGVVPYKSWKIRQPNLFSKKRNLSHRNATPFIVVCKKATPLLKGGGGCITSLERWKTRKSSSKIKTCMSITIESSHESQEERRRTDLSQNIVLTSFWAALCNCTKSKNNYKIPSERRFGNWYSQKEIFYHENEFRLDI